MGLSGISPLSLLLILFIALVFLGPNRMQRLGDDLGKAIKQFRRALDQNDKGDQS